MVYKVLIAPGTYNSTKPPRDDEFEEVASFSEYEDAWKYCHTQVTSARGILIVLRDTRDEILSEEKVL